MTESKTAAVTYTTSLAGVEASMLGGFFEGWRRPLTPQQHLRLLRGSSHVVLAIDERAGKVVAFINALTDGCNSAFLPMLEVLPGYRRRGVGTELLRRMLQVLADYPCIDLTCDPAMQPFYANCGMQRSVGMAVRDYSRSGPAERGR